MFDNPRLTDDPGNIVIVVHSRWGELVHLTNDNGEDIQSLVGQDNSATNGPLLLIGSPLSPTDQDRHGLPIPANNWRKNCEELTQLQTDTAWHEFAKIHAYQYWCLDAHLILKRAAYVPKGVMPLRNRHRLVNQRIIIHETSLNNLGHASIAKDNKNRQTVPNRQQLIAGIGSQFG